MNKLNITEYNLLDYSLKLQEAVEKGYRISDSVEGSPMMVGFVYATTLVKREDDVVGELNTEVTLMVGDKVEAVVKEIVDKAPSKRGRK